MANTTFSGAVRSENNFKLISKTASTGVVHDRTQSFGLKDARRYYLYEAFSKKPTLADDPSLTVPDFTGPENVVVPIIIILLVCESSL